MAVAAVVGAEAVPEEVQVVEEAFSEEAVVVHEADPAAAVDLPGSDPNHLHLRRPGEAEALMAPQGSHQDHTAHTTTDHLEEVGQIDITGIRSSSCVRTLTTGTVALRIDR